MATPLLDVNVVLSVARAANPVNLGNLAGFIIGPDDSGVLQKDTVYTSVDDLDDTERHDTAVFVRAYFSQQNNGKKLFIYGVQNDSQLSEKLDDVYYDDWEFATVIANVNTPTNETAFATVSNYIESKNSKFFVVTTALSISTITKEVLTDFKTMFSGNQRTIMFITSGNSDDLTIAASYIGALGNTLPGSITWKFKTIGGLTAFNNISSGLVSAATEAGINLYVVKDGKNQTSEGKTINGEYIDNLHGDDWVRASIGSGIQNLLETSEKLAYSIDGINQIEAVVTASLMQATNNGIILVDSETQLGMYRVTATGRDQQSAADISSRQYGGLSFTYTRAGAIHEVTVHGTINE